MRARRNRKKRSEIVNDRPKKSEVKAYAVYSAGGDIGSKTD